MNPNTTLIVEGEYTVLRKELLEWQNRRFGLLPVAVAVVGATLALDVMKHERAKEVWEYLASLDLLFLSTLLLVTWYCAYSNSKIAAYLEVFHEGPAESLFQWEKRLGAFGKSLNVNQLLAVVYFVLAVIAVGALWRSASISPASLWNPGLSLAGLGFVVCIGLNLIPTNCWRTRHKRKWEMVKNSYKPTS